MAQLSSFYRLTQNGTSEQERIWFLQGSGTRDMRKC